MKKNIIILSLLVILPTVALAQNAGYDIWSFWDYFFHIVKRLTQICWVVAVMTFLFGLVQFLWKADSADAQKKGKELMKGSIIAFFIALSFWGLVTFTIKAFNFAPDSSGNIPTITSAG